MWTNILLKIFVKRVKGWLYRLYCEQEIYQILTMTRNVCITLLPTHTTFLEFLSYAEHQEKNDTLMQEFRMAFKAHNSNQIS